MPKHMKKVMMLLEKVKVLDMVKEGRSKSAVARHYDMNESTIRSICKCEAAIRKTVSTSACQLAKTSKSVRDKNIVRMESSLILWITVARKKT